MRERSGEAVGRAVNSLGIPRPKTSRASREDMSIPWREMGLLMCFGRESARVEGDLCAMVFVRATTRAVGGIGSCSCCYLVRARGAPINDRGGVGGLLSLSFVDAFDRGASAALVPGRSTRLCLAMQQYAPSSGASARTAAGWYTGARETD